MLYEALGRLVPSPVDELNRAVEVSTADGPAAALPIVDELVAAYALSNSRLLHSVRGDLLTRWDALTSRTPNSKPCCVSVGTCVSGRCSCANRQASG